jgi:hypothetical protein
MEKITMKLHYLWKNRAHRPSKQLNEIQARKLAIEK